MTAIHQLLAFDFGASSGRAILGRFDSNRIDLQEIHRFSNDPVRVGKHLHWDILRLLFEIKQGLVKAKAYGPIDSLGIDTWGVDFGLIDEVGNLLDNPIHYRDTYTQGIMEKVFEIIPREELYQQTGIQFMSFNTIFQLYALSKERPELLERASHLLLMPDLMRYLLTGEAKTEFTIASTGQMLDIQTGDWHREILNRLGLPLNLLPPVIAPGTPSLPLSPDICDELGISPIQTVAVTSHDTASAVVAVPSEKKDFIYISSGTWSLMGVETTTPVVNDLSYQYQFTNEGGYNHTTRLLKNIMGLWLIQECRRQWIREGAEVSFADLEREALVCEPFRSLIDPDAAILATPGDMPGRIRKLCRESGQPVPQSRGEVIRCVYESLALMYRVTKEKIEAITGVHYDQVHIVGGGTKDTLLSQFAANATGSRVVAGPIEATALGNIAVQLLGQGILTDLDHARRVIAASCELKEYIPQDVAEWNEALGRFNMVIK